MTPTEPRPEDGPTSGRRVVMASALAVAAAVTILFVAVLPAEYGLDPLGSGRLLGLMPAAASTATEAAPSPSGHANPMIPTSVGPARYFAASFATDAATFEIGPYDYVEYKYRLEQGASLTFAWRATAPVLHDLHGDPDGADDHDEESFDRRQLREAFGTHTAPFAGLHGWMWENPGGTPITVRLTSAGFYASATEFRPNRRQFPHVIVPALR